MLKNLISQSFICTAHIFTSLLVFLGIRLFRACNLRLSSRINLKKNHEGYALCVYRLYSCKFFLLNFALLID